METPEPPELPRAPLTGKEKLQVPLFLGCWFGAQIGLAMFIKRMENKENEQKREAGTCRGR